MGNVVIGVFGGRPVYLREVAEILDGSEEPSQYVLFGSGKHIEEPAVTLSIAKRPGANAIAVADEVMRKVDLLKGKLIPAEVTVTVTRNYGETAAEKSNELLLHMGIAIFSVALLIWLTLGWRESGIVAVAIPATLALTLLVFYLYGFTLNRITLFALIFSIGILVDDAIVVVENIVRHFHLPSNQGRDWSAIAVEAVNEVGNPTILATFAVIAAVLPMAFVGGLMGPYMRPIPDRRERGHVLVAAHRLHRHPVGVDPDPRLGKKIPAERRVPQAVLGILPNAAPSEPAEPSPRTMHGGFFHQTLPPRDGPADPSPRLALGVSSRHHAAAAGVLRHRRPRLGESENAALRQQERVPDHPQHAGRRLAGTNHRRRPRDGGRHPRRTGSHQLADLCRRRLALQFQRPGAPLLHAPRRQHRRHPGQPRAQSTSAAPKATTSPSASARGSPPSRSAIRRASPSPRCRPARRCCKPSSPKSTAPTKNRGSSWRKK